MSNNHGMAVDIKSSSVWWARVATEQPCLSVGSHNTPSQFYIRLHAKLRENADKTPKLIGLLSIQNHTDLQLSALLSSTHLSSSVS